MKFADLEGYSPGTELYWNGAFLWQNGDGSEDVIVRPERLVKNGPEVRMLVREYVYSPQPHGQATELREKWVTLAGIRGPLAPCRSRIEERREWTRKAYATKAARDAHAALRREELAARFKALGYSPSNDYDMWGNMLTFKESDLQRILNVLETDEVTNAWEES